MAAIGKDTPVIIKKIKKGGGHGHHGGAWKVAYADFVTAMMAFFLLMWLLSSTTQEQRQGIADYFAPASVTMSNSGSGGILGGTALGQDGDKNSGTMSTIQQLAPKAPDVPTDQGESENSGSPQNAAIEAARQAQVKQESDSFASAAMSLRQALEDMPELAELSKQVLVDQTPEGLRIQLVDQEGRSMFKDSSAQPNDRARLLLKAISKVLAQLPNRVTISGHTSANASGGQNENDWPLSAARANISRQILQGSGVAADRIYQVSGKANSDPLYPDDPTLAGNRRISIVLLREKPVLPPDQGF